MNRPALERREQQIEPQVMKLLDYAGALGGEDRVRLGSGEEIERRVIGASILLGNRSDEIGFNWEGTVPRPKVELVEIEGGKKRIEVTFDRDLFERIEREAEVWSPGGAYPDVDDRTLYVYDALKRAGQTGAKIRSFDDAFGALTKAYELWRKI
ncbi:hypothetical protein A2703_04145 [Candidatus Collierbacteria bacterium RIFCSPHIGHO2_01_FULL_50_25]|uniref:Uncharacterized protein n=1 Tax=Candidatus Collierbacteria bacterium RIFCSPHIGHO2_01_FULL_50_25 TaxID=1817722 RepID=A0A1F5EYH9_9BACT|nr:MAG: hypothetical protein A2703_04145 [Candidatus Collierbacteria bacterium RIFCSPHIGHO2_01_FULL_50_25]